MTVTRKTNGEEYYGISSDTKPRESQINSIFHELDTGKDYFNTIGSTLYYENTMTTKNGAYPNVDAAGWISEPNECKPIPELERTAEYEIYLDGRSLGVMMGTHMVIDGQGMMAFGDAQILVGSTGTYFFAVTDYDQTAIFATNEPSTHTLKLVKAVSNQWYEIGAGVVDVG